MKDDKLETINCMLSLVLQQAKITITEEQLLRILEKEKN